MNMRSLFASGNGNLSDRDSFEIGYWLHLIPEKLKRYICKKYTQLF